MLEEIELRHHTLVSLTGTSVIYARPDGGNYHLYKECLMLGGGQFEELNYKIVSLSEVKKRKLMPCSCAYKDSKEHLIHEGRNQVLYLLLCIGDENVAHDNYHPDIAEALYRARVEICKRFKHPRPDGKGVMNTIWPAEGDWPDFEKYTYRPG